MPYTLAKGFVWVLLAMLLGIVIGALLRNIVAKRQVARARNHHVDTAEMERLRGRIANLEPVVAERDRLKAELDDCRSGAAPAAPPPEASTAAVRGFAAVGGTAVDDTESAPPTAPAAPDVDAARSVLGRAIAADDLKVVEGIGPKIEELCNGIGIRTWFDLATTEVSLLRTMLVDAGSRFRTHDPATWPEQAELLSQGRWDDFKALTDDLHGGRAVD